MVRTRFFAASDVHGSNLCFRKFVNAGKFYGAEVLILGGDVTGKTMVPIVRLEGGGFKFNDGGDSAQVLESEERLDAVIKEMGDRGQYPYVTDPGEFEELSEKPELVDRLFKKLMVERLESWMKLADERLTGTGKRCYISPGNDDVMEIDEALDSGTRVINPEGKVVEIDGQHEMITLGYTNRTPWNSSREADEDILLEKIGAMADRVKDMGTAIFNLHVPPIDTPIDQAPKLDKNLKPIVSGGDLVMASAGSSAVRESIERYQPLVGIHGHIHESRGTVKIGRTMCFNPGSEYNSGILRGLLCELDGGSIRSYMLTSG
ncbi:MAG: metallophosphoesterase [Thaumarchaeota archaeon]|nr:metallophosphoesterase [Nitrososphaerota archaeon]